jgi:NADPH:quinone reductase
MRAIQIQEFGGPELMQLVDLPVPQPGEGELLVRITRAGVNFADTHQRENAYIRKFELPLIPGGEVAGVVERSGDGPYAEGQRVVAMTGAGGYAEYVAAPAAATFPIPDGVGDELALALLIQGLTAWHLFRTSAQLRRGGSVVVHSAAGGVGSLAVQLARPFGAGRVIASASSEDKRRQALELGGDAAIDSRAEELTAAIVEANEGRPVDVVLEMAGGRSFDQSLDALAPFGRLVLYGLATREQSQIPNGRLLRRSQGVIGFWLMHCLERLEMLRDPLRDLFERAARGELSAIAGGTYPLPEARHAHEELLSRRTSGKLVLDPTR